MKLLMAVSLFLALMIVGSMEYVRAADDVYVVTIPGGSTAGVVKFTYGSIDTYIVTDEDGETNTFSVIEYGDESDDYEDNTNSFGDEKW